MKPPKMELRLEGRVEMHLAGGMTKLAVKFGGMHSIDVRTDDIPPDARALGSKVMVIFKESEEIFQTPSGEQARTYDGAATIMKLPENPEFGWFPAST